MVKDSNQDPAVIRADGGLVANSFMCQFLADMLGKPVDVPRVHETTALGAAYLAGLQSGVYQDLDDIQNSWQSKKCYKPTMEDSQRKNLYKGWQEALSCVL